MIAPWVQEEIHGVDLEDEGNMRGLMGTPGARAIPWVQSCQTIWVCLICTAIPGSGAQKNINKISK
jgi:hypothetical protein